MRDALLTSSCSLVGWCSYILQTLSINFSVDLLFYLITCGKQARFSWLIVWDSFIFPCVFVHACTAYGSRCYILRCVYEECGCVCVYITHPHMCLRSLLSQIGTVGALRGREMCQWSIVCQRGIPSAQTALTDNSRHGGKEPGSKKCVSSLPHFPRSASQLLPCYTA